MDSQKVGEMQIDQKQITVPELRQMVWKDARHPNIYDKKNPLKKGYVERRQKAFEEAEQEIARENQLLAAEQKTSPWSWNEDYAQAITSEEEQGIPKQLAIQPEETVTTVMQFSKNRNLNEPKELESIVEKPTKTRCAKTTKSVTIKCDRDQNEVEKDLKKEMEYQYILKTYRVSYNPLDEEEKVNWRFNEIWSQSTRFQHRTAIVKMECKYDKNAPLVEFA